MQNKNVFQVIYSVRGKKFSPKDTGKYPGEVTGTCVHLTQAEF